MITVVLLKPETPENIGFICRSMANFDLSSLIIIEPFCDPLDEQALRVSMHAKKILKNAKIQTYEDFSKLNKKFDLIVGTTSVLGSDYNLPRTPLSPREFSTKITNQKIALVFGNEGTGLSNEEIKQCDFVISIPTSKKYSAMNISHAASTIFYELFLQTKKEKIDSHIKKASHKEREIILEKIDDLIHSVYFSTKEKQETQRKAWKNILEKSMMSKREAYAVIGLLKKLHNKNKINKS
ncbi:RNA methyltransferase [archaeon]|jgi:tRNA/rRNA methyltransferase|nr:RNA methyltransferase [archaeon]MBT4022989.1 RNA methyltransferase [archaeon]MBT4271980.1 RNA methyltransferase [archaeon]MBT4461818.1 RNA methyltransferase [archaeon]MBT4858167.1 RNA methyltransferase [archaeon]